MGRFDAKVKTPTAMAFEKCAAKTTPDGAAGIDVLAHCQNVHSVAEALMAYLPNSLHKKIREPALLATALHDVGKVSPGFQKKYFNNVLSQHCPDLAAMSNSGFETNHAAISHAAINHSLRKGSDPSSIALVAGAHHGSISKKGERADTVGPFGGPSWSQERGKLIKMLIQSLDLKTESVCLEHLWPVVAGLVSTADWIGSDEHFFPSDTGIAASDMRLAKARGAVSSCGWSKLPLKQGLNFDQVFGFPPYPSQQSFIDSVTSPGLYIFEAPMGLGKTEAALFAVYRLMADRHHNGFYFGLPSRLTSDKIHERVRRFLKTICDEPVPVQLAHGNAWMRAFLYGAVNQDEKEGGLWFTPRKRSLLCPFAVGTIDQALLSVLRVKHFFVRAFGLAGKVVILDEVHSYDVYTGTIMDSMIKGLLDWGCTVIILSATLTRERRNELLFTTSLYAQGEKHLTDPYPLISWKHPNAHPASLSPAPPKSLQYQLKVRDWNSRQVASEATARAMEGQCVLCIANTVAQAQFWFDAVAAERSEDDFEIGLMHARYPAFARDALEREWMAKLGKEGPRPKSCVLVATQVVEQSVDIDADVLITELCPTDMLLQRMGRQWRHPRASRPSQMAETFIVTKPVHASASCDDVLEALGRTNCLVYAPYVLMRSFQVWSRRSVVKLPEDVRTLLEETYAVHDKEESPAAAELRRQLQDTAGKLKQIAQSAAASVSSLPVMEDREDVATRYSDMPMVDVLLVSGLKPDGYKADVTLLDGSRHTLSSGLKNFHILAKLHSNLLSMPRYRLQRMGALSMPHWLEGIFYETTPVLRWNMDDGTVTFDGRSTGYLYDTRRGLRWAQDKEDTASTSGSAGDEFCDLDVFDKNRFDW
jgi:CRISPR-associated endonuclease/helicase Cas3